MSTAEQSAVSAYNFNSIVASNIRAELARGRWSGRKAADALGVGPMYVSRRLSGETPMDANDIAMFARLVDVPISALFTATQKTPSRGGLGVSLPDLDSNQEPIGIKSAAELVNIEDYRATKMHGHTATATHEGIVTPMFGAM